MADPPIYHERQHLQRCLLHTVNNLLQQQQYTPQQLNQISDQLQHARRTMFLGNYDVNALDAVCQLHNWELRWHDARDTQLQRLQLDDPLLVGLVLNVPGRSLLSWLTAGRHWVALRMLHGTWYNLDSNLPHPQPFPTSPEDPAGQQALRAYLQEQLQQQGQLFLVLEHTAGAGGRSEVAGEALPVDAMPPAAAAAKLTTQ